MPAPIYDPTVPIDPNSPWAQVTPPDDDDCQAVIASDMWLGMEAPPEEVAKYSGMHIAVQGKLIVDGDPDFNVLANRLETNPAAYPLNRLLFRYIPPADQPLGRYSPEMDVARVRLYLLAEKNNTVFRFVRPGGTAEAITALRPRTSEGPGRRARPAERPRR